MVKFYLALAFCTTLVACQGQNPFQRQNNPTQKYARSRAIAPYADPAAGLPDDSGGRPPPNPSSPVRVRFLNTPTAAVHFGDSFMFKIEITDNQATSAPEVTVGLSSKESTSDGKKITLLDASAAVDCKGLPLHNWPSQWLFECKFYSNLIKDVDSFLGKDVSKTAAFEITLLDKKADRKSQPSGLKIEIHFAKVTGDRK